MRDARTKSAWRTQNKIRPAITRRILQPLSPIVSPKAVAIELFFLTKMKKKGFKMDQANYESSLLTNIL